MFDICIFFDEFQVCDFEDNLIIIVIVEYYIEIGNCFQFGFMVCYMGNIVNFEFCYVECWVYQVIKVKQDVYFLVDYLWVVYIDQFVKVFFVFVLKLMVCVEVKVCSKCNLVVKEYEFLFVVDF